MTGPDRSAPQCSGLFRAGLRTCGLEGDDALWQIAFPRDPPEQGREPRSGMRESAVTTYRCGGSAGLARQGWLNRTSRLTCQTGTVGRHPEQPRRLSG